MLAGSMQPIVNNGSLKETLENPTILRENAHVIAGMDRLHGRQAVRLG